MTEPAARLVCQWCGRPIPTDHATWWDSKPQCESPFTCADYIVSIHNQHSKEQK